MIEELSVLVLGPTAARARDGVIELGGQQQRRLLTALALEAGSVVSADRLIERIWHESPLPADPRASLRTYLTRLRKALDIEDVLVTDPLGWALDPDIVELDVRRFERLVEAGEEPGLDVHQRLARLDEALSLWRGEAYEDVAGEEWIQVEADRLSELRATAIERRFEAMLIAGMHTDALPGLLAQAEAEPYRDRLVGLQMLALFRCGRVAEATRAFQAHRDRLGVELGLEPGTELVQLDHRILANDPSLHLGSPSGRPLRGYRLGEQLGEGAFAIVFRGTQPSLGRDVAVKVIRAELANRPEFVRRFEAEAFIIARLEHPHIVPLYDYWREPGRACLVFRYLRGGTLESHLTSVGGISLDRAVTLVDHVGAALVAAHDAGVVHRDVKPANVFLDEVGNFYLGDFGIALEAAELSEPQAALSAGSPAYASPEQLRREPVGPTTDVHGLGISLYEALTGRLPFPAARSEAELLQHQLNDPIPSIKAHRGDLPVGVDEVIARATAKNPADRYQAVDQLMAELKAILDAASTGVPRRAGATTAIRAEEARNPYKGLRPFTEADASDFYGRERLVDRLIGVLGKTGTQGRIAALVGPSGIGKSSVVRAGLLPALRRGEVPGSDCWYVATMLPGSSPFDELAAALLRVATRIPDNLMAQLTDDRRGIARVVKAIAPEDGDVLLMVDQFEELFTLADPAITRQFLDALEHALTDARCPLRVVLTMRADFWDRPLRHGPFARLIDSSTINVTALAPDELERAITTPAHLVGCEFEPGLVAEIVADVTDQPGALPLLQYAMTELWNERVSDLLTRDAYRRLGGVAGALTRRADELYQSSDRDDQRTIRRIMGRLVSLGEGTVDTRRRALRSELAPSPEADSLIDRFGAARLLAFDTDPATREPTVEVAHEALIREWPQLRSWLDEDRDELRLREHLHRAAAEWDRSGRPTSELYRGGRLESVGDWATGDTFDLRPLDHQFIDASLAERKNDDDAERRRLRRLRSLLAMVATIAVVALIAGGLAVVQRASADDERTRAEQNARLAEDNEALAVAAAQEADAAATRADVQRLATEATVALDEDPDLAILLALEAYDRSQTLGETPGAVVAALQRTTQASRLIALHQSTSPFMGLSPDGETLAIGAADQESVIVLSDITSGDELERIEIGQTVGHLSYSTDGSRLLILFDDDSEGGEPPSSAGMVYDLDLGRSVVELTGRCCARGNAKFSPDGRFVVATRELDGQLSVVAWDLAQPMSAPKILGPGSLGGGFTPDGRVPVLGADSAISLVSPDTLETASVTLPGASEIAFVSANTASDLIVVTSNAGVQLWVPGATSPEQQIDLRLPGGALGFFGADGRLLYFLGQDDEVQVLDRASGEVIGLRGHSGIPAAVATTPDDSVLAVATFSGEILVWDLSPTGPRELGNLPSEGFIDDLEIAPDNSTIAVGEEIGPSSRVRQFDRVSGEQVAESTGLVNYEALGGTERVAGTTSTGEIVLQDLADGEQVGVALDDCESPAAVDDQGRWILVAGDFECGAQGGRVVDVATGDVLARWDEGVGWVDFGPSSTVAEGLVALQRGTDGLRPNEDGSVIEIHHVVDDRLIAEIEVFDGWRPFFSGDGRYLSFGSGTSGGHVYDIEKILAGTGPEDAEVLNPLVQGGVTTFTVAGGGYLVTGHSGEVVRFWDLESGEEWLSLPVDSRGPTMHAVSADGRYYYYADTGGVVRRFPLDPTDLADVARKRVNRDLTAEECTRFLLADRCASSS